MKEVSTKGYKLLKKTKDDKFDVDLLHQYNLYLLIGIRDLQVGVICGDTNRILLLEDYGLSSVKSYQELVAILENLFDDHHLLKAGFWNEVKVGLKNNKFSLVPSGLFMEEAILDYLKLNCRINPETDNLNYYRHLKSDAVNCFAINKRLADWLGSLYPTKQVCFLHQSSGLIEGALSELSRAPKDSIFVYIDRFKIHIIASKNGSLEYYNQFQVKEFDDYIKYIMLVMKGLERDQKTTPVTLWGYLGQSSKHYKELSKYIKNISFGSRPKFLKFNYMFDEIQDHQYFDLYSLHLCE